MREGLFEERWGYRFELVGSHHSAWNEQVGSNPKPEVINRPSQTKRQDDEIFCFGIHKDPYNIR
jgi:hypothetical protein